MSRYIRLGGTASYIDLDDQVNYKIIRASDNEAVTYQVVSHPIRNTGRINLGMSKAVERVFTSDVLIRGTSWSSVLQKQGSIQTQLTNAEQYAMYGSGAQVLRQEAQGDQSSPTVYNVVRGEVVENRTFRLVPHYYTSVRLKLVCEPGTV